MIARLFGLGRGPRVMPYLPAGVRVYAVGDIHGRADLLQRLLGQLAADRAAHPDRDIVLIFLGDYIDRGDDSAEVLDLLLADPLPGVRRVFLRGNHEQFLLDFLEDPVRSADWLAYGGQSALLSWGVKLSRIPVRPQDFVELRDQLRERLPDAHLAFILATRNCFDLGSYYFVHAGIRPGVPLAEQMPADQLWIRGEFISSRRNHECIIVHGHTISDEPELLPNRIGIDTGAYLTGVLTALVLEGERMEIVQTA